MPQNMKDQLNDWYLMQGGVQKSFRDITLDGLVRLGYKVMLELEDNENGPRQSPDKYFVLDILMKIYCGKVHMFQSILR